MTLFSFRWRLTYAVTLCTVAFSLASQPQANVEAGTASAQEERERNGPPDACDQAVQPDGAANGLHKRCEGSGGGGGAAKGDFNGDGFADLAVGVPFEDQNGINAVGGVNIIYGSAQGLTSAGDQFLDPSTFGLAYVSNDHFGWALAAGDFNADGFSDLAIGMPDRDDGKTTNVGMVLLIFGSDSGLDTATAKSLPLLSGRHGSAGEALVWADFNGDTYADLAVGIPGAIFAVRNYFTFLFFCEARDLVAGEVQVFYGSPTGLTQVGAQRLRQGSIDGDDCNAPSKSVAGNFPGAGDRFGSILAAGDFNADEKADLVVGVPLENYSVTAVFPDDAGIVQLVPGSSTGLVPAKTQEVSQATSGIGGGAELGDQFGRALAVGDFNADLRDDLAIGVPFEDLLDNTAADAGVVHVLPGSFETDELVTVVGSQFISQATLAGVIVEAGDRFGWSLATGRFDDDFLEDLAVGVPGEAIGTIAKAGIVHVIYGSVTGLSSSRVQTWHQNTIGIPDVPESGDQFGYALSAWNFGSTDRSDLAIGVPFEDLATSNGVQEDAGAVLVIFGGSTGLTTVTASQFWHQDVSGINDVAQPGDRFGNVLY